MKLTAELSLYPLQDDYIQIIKSFIARCHDEEGITVVGNAMSTQLCGDYDRVFTLVAEALRDSTERYGKQVLVCKFIPGELPIAG